VEHPLITNVTYSIEEARLTLTNVPHEPSKAGRITQVLAQHGVNIDVIIQNHPTSPGDRADISLSIPRWSVAAAREALAELETEMGLTYRVDPNMGKVSITGAGLRSHPEVAAKVFTVLGDNQINIEMIVTSPIVISCVINGDDVERAVHALHSAFELVGADTILRERPFGEFV
jgi:aspartate kinase